MMTSEQQTIALELLREAVHKSLDPDFDIRVSRLFVGIANNQPEIPEAVPIVIREVVGSVRPVYGPKDSPLNEYIGGPA